MNKNIEALILELELQKKGLYKNLRKNNALFIKDMEQFRNFILVNSSEKEKYYNSIQDLKKHKKYIELKKFFYEAECYWEFIEEIKEKENIKKTLKNTSPIDIQLIRKNLKNLFGRETIDNASREADWIELEKYNRIIMVGCGSFPYTLLTFAYKYPNIQFIGVDKNKNAINNAIDLKEFLKMKNIKFELKDGKKYNYSEGDLIIIADLASDKENILNQIYRSNKDARVIIRNPILYGILICDEFNMEKEERYKLIDTFLPSENELYINLLIERG